jgi:hypothetical protein
MIDALPRAARLLGKQIPATDRESILGDLAEEASWRGLRGRRRDWWLIAECGAIGAGFSVHRAKRWFVMPSLREVAAGLVVDGQLALRGHPRGTLIPALMFVASVAMLALGVEILVRTLMTAAGF